MSKEYIRQLTFLDKFPKPYQEESPLLGQRSILDVLNDDFEPTIQKIRKTYLPKNSFLLLNSNLLNKAIGRMDQLKNLNSNEISYILSKDIALASNIQTLKKRELFLPKIRSQKSHLPLAHNPNSSNWENEIRLSTDKLFINLKTKLPESIKKSELFNKESTTQRLWLISTVFNPSITHNFEDRIAGEDMLTAELFTSYFCFLREKERFIKDIYK